MFIAFITKIWVVTVSIELRIARAVGIGAVQITSITTSISRYARSYEHNYQKSQYFLCFLLKINYFNIKSPLKLPLESSHP